MRSPRVSGKSNNDYVQCIINIQINIQILIHESIIEINLAITWKFKSIDWTYYITININFVAIIDQQWTTIIERNAQDILYYPRCVLLQAVWYCVILLLNCKLCNVLANLSFGLYCSLRHIYHWQVKTEIVIDLSYIIGNCSNR